MLGLAYRDFFGVLITKRVGIGYLSCCKVSVQKSVDHIEDTTIIQWNLLS